MYDYDIFTIIDYGQGSHGLIRVLFIARMLSEVNLTHDWRSHFPSKTTRFVFEFQPKNAKWTLPRNPQSFRCRVAGNLGVFHTLDEK